MYSLSPVVIPTVPCFMYAVSRFLWPFCCLAVCTSRGKETERASDVLRVGVVGTFIQRAGQHASGSGSNSNHRLCQSTFCHLTTRSKTRPQKIKDDPRSCDRRRPGALVSGSASAAPKTRPQKSEDDTALFCPAQPPPPPRPDRTMSDAESASAAPETKPKVEEATRCNSEYCPPQKCPPPPPRDIIL